MKKIFVLLFLVSFLFLLSCSDDNSTKPETSVLNGTWSGLYVTSSDTAYYNCKITESKGKISGNCELHGYHKTVRGNRTVTDITTRKMDVSGEFENSEVKIKFYSYDYYHFKGKLSEDKMSIEGELSIYYIAIDSTIDYYLTLYKK